MTAPTPPATGTRRRVLVVDDHPIVRRGLTLLLDLEADLVVAGEADNAAHALAQLRVKSFDLAIVDISLPGISGVDLLKDLKIHWPQLPVLMLSVHDELLYAERSLRAGARGYLMKQESPETIVTAIRRVLDGQVHVSDAVNTRILGRLTGGGGKPLDGLFTDALSNRELEVFRLIGRGRGTREIAHDMHVSVKTVETYRVHIKTKLQLKSAPELMRFAVEWANQQEMN